MAAATPGRAAVPSFGMLAEINVTPFVDVMLVLLIIFMLTAHVMEFGIEVDVPKTRAVQDSAKDTAGGEYHQGRHALPQREARQYQRPSGRDLTPIPGATAVYLRADKETVWEPIAQVMSELGTAKLQVNAVTQPEDAADKRRR